MIRVAVILLAVLVGWSIVPAEAGCRGLCYGVTSARTGLPRNTYVHSYVRRDGTAVGAYTRSH